jgi:hypothetical protein
LDPAMARKAISQGEPITMRPEFALMGFGWYEEGTGHETFSLQPLF